MRGGCDLSERRSVVAANMWSTVQICGVQFKYVEYSSNMWSIVQICGVQFKYVEYSSNVWSTVQMCGVQLIDRKGVYDMMLMLSLNLSMDLLAMASSVHWYDDLLMRKRWYVLIRPSDLEVEGQRTKIRLKRTWKEWVMKNA